MARTGKKRKPSARRNVAAAPPAAAPVATRVWRPGVDSLENDEELLFDPSTYNCLHAFHLGWPCLSFDFVRDSLGALRHEFPHTMFLVAGTQADTSSNNSIAVVKLSNVTGKQRSPHSVPGANDSESASDDSDDEEEEEMLNAEGSNKTPKLDVRMIAHQGCVNRIRAMQQQPHIAASWSDRGFVQVWDFTSHLNSLNSTVIDGDVKISHHAPLQIFKNHKDEGYALDWSSLATGRLLSGDCHGWIYFWEPTSDGKWNTESPPLLGHAKSVEDLQWSPSEENVFASCSVDKTIGIWDIRSRKREISVKAHDKDVNVISWNRLTSCMLASGSDSGVFRVWDLRAFKEDSAVAHFTHHSSPITSIEWSSHESSTLALTSEDNQLSIWDVALERDTEEEAQYQMELGQQQAAAPDNLPPQLLFVHQGQKDMKEVHWHPQIHGLMVSTAGDGFNVFRPCNL